MTAPTQAPSKDVITAPENPTLDDLIAFYGDSNFRSGVTVRVPYGATQRALEELRRLRAPRTCEWCDQGIPKSKDGRRHESQYGVWACSAGEPHPATKDQLKRYRFTKSGMFPMEDGQWVSWSDHRAEIEQYREWVEPQLERLGRVTADEPYSGHEPRVLPEPPSSLDDILEWIRSMSDDEAVKNMASVAIDKWHAIQSRAAQPPRARDADLYEWVSALVEALKLVGKSSEHDADYLAELYSRLSPPPGPLQALIDAAIKWRSSPPSYHATNQALREAVDAYSGSTKGGEQS